MTHAPAPPEQPHYKLKFETISGSGADIRLRSLLDRQQYHDPQGKAEAMGISSATWPIFGLLWPSGRVLAHAMQTFDMEGKKILEVGCGLALASLVFHRRGGDITASDCHPLAGAFLRANLKLNGLPPMKYRTGNWAGDNPRLGRFDVIIGSDLLYDRDQPEALSRFIDRHALPGAEVLIVDPDRGNRASFNKKMAILGYSHTETKILSLPGGGAAYKGRLLRYFKAPAAAPGP